MLDSQSYGFQESLAETTRRRGRFIIGCLVQFHAIVFVENDPAGEIQHGTSTLHFGNGERQPIRCRQLRRDREQDHSTWYGDVAHNDPGPSRLTADSFPPAAWSSQIEKRDDVAGLKRRLDP